LYLLSHWFWRFQANPWIATVPAHPFSHFIALSASLFEYIAALLIPQRNELCLAKTLKMKWSVVFTFQLFYLFRLSLSYNATLGEAIRGSGKSIYLLRDGIKHFVTDWNYFLSLGYEVGDIHHYSDSKIGSFPNGDPITPNSSPIQKEQKNVPAVSLPPLLPCPCRSSSSHDIRNEEMLHNHTSRIHMACLVKNLASSLLLDAIHVESLSLSFKFISEEDSRVIELPPNENTTYPTSLQGCDVVIKFSEHFSIINQEKMERRCPGICKPYPFIEIPVPLLSQPYQLNRSLSCTMTLSSALSHGTTLNHGTNSRHVSLNNSNNVVSTTRSIDTILHSIARRRVEECLERGFWPLGSFSKHNNSINDVHIGRHSAKWSNSSYLLPQRSRFARRKLYGLIIWIGSNSRHSMLLAQTESLRLQQPHWNDSEKIYGWIATEDQYPCRKEFPGCKSQYAYHWMMPSTKMAYDGRTGWGCAQRRPLRALSHTLLLFDPDFLLVPFASEMLCIIACISLVFIYHVSKVLL